MKTKAAVLHGVGEEWKIEEVDLGDPVAGEVQVRLTATGLCHSDHHVRSGDESGGDIELFPIVGGHEGAGVVTKVGPGVTRLAPGDHVVTAFIPACGVCEPCSRGLQNLCDLGMYLFEGVAIADQTHRVTQNGVGVMQQCLVGTFSPYITVHEASVVKIEDDIPLHLAALLGCGVATGWGSAVEIGATKADDTVLVVGVGGVGMNAVQGARAAGARFVIAIDPVPFKLETAKKFGATHTFDSIDAALPEIEAITWGKMANTVILTQGRMEGAYLQPALTMTAKGGQVVVTGLGSATAEDVKLSLYELTLLQKRVQGAIFGGSGPRSMVPKLLNEYRAGRLNLDDLITRTYRLEEINQAYDDMLEGRNIRGVVLFDDSDY
jgi:S-(hydroxymethyl)glutathione dehydrogenase/alcohol dehydrogenase